MSAIYDRFDALFTRFATSRWSSALFIAITLALAVGNVVGWMGRDWPAHGFDFRDAAVVGMLMVLAAMLPKHFTQLLIGFEAANGIMPPFEPPPGWTPPRPFNEHGKEVIRQRYRRDAERMAAKLEGLPNARETLISSAERQAAIQIALGGHDRTYRIRATP